MYIFTRNRISTFNFKILLRHRRNDNFRKKFHNGLQLRKQKDIDCNAKDKKPKMDPGCKVALITGGISGIGFAIANELLCAGARGVAITGMDLCKGKESASCLVNSYGKNKAIFINGNVNCMNQFEDTFKTVLKTYKRLDIVVNAAGICDGPQWEREVVTNVVGTIRGTLLAYQYVGKEGGGKGGMVLNISGIAGLTPFPPAPTMSACQHAIVGLSRSFGDKSHVQRSGVRVLTLCPGFTKTEFIKNVGRRAMSDILAKDLEAVVKSGKKQAPDVVGKSAIHLIKFGKSGSVWVIDGSRLFSLKLPHWDKHAKLQAQYL